MEGILKISAVIPTYNRRTQVFRAIDSVLAQTSPVDEIIVVDDGSTDGTSDSICSSYGTGVALYRQENGGVSAARNKGIREARGEWIAFLDSDDVWLPTKIERQLEAVARFGATCGLCFTDNYFGGNPDLELSAFEETGFGSSGKVGMVEEPTDSLLAGREPFFTSSLLVLRSLLEGIGEFDETLVVGEDADIVMRLSLRTKFCFVAEPLVEVDRTPSRSGLCNLYTTRDDRKYESFERRYTKWLQMSEIEGTKYEQLIRKMLREFRYDSFEAKIHDLRLGPACDELHRIRKMGEGYIAVITTLLRRKLAKVKRRWGDATSSPYANSPGEGSAP
jgi:glycosyltransferase involved in cell wall biosynthesis